MALRLPQTAYNNELDGVLYCLSRLDVDSTIRAMILVTLSGVFVPSLCCI